MTSRGGGNVITISLAMIVKNEEEHLARCLDSIKDVVDEINIVDTGSTDHTKEIARNYTDRLFDFKWIDDFAAARNESFSKATMDYVLWLDADDVLLPKDQEQLLLLKKQLQSSVDAVSMFYHIRLDAQGKPTFSFRRNRLVKRSRSFHWHGFVHEYLEVYGNIVQSDAAVTHLEGESSSSSDRNLKIFEKRLKSGTKFTPRDLYYYANECFDHRKYDRATEYYEKFLNTKKGWSEDCIDACGKLAAIALIQGQKQKAIDYCLKSFTYDLPRAEHCCRLGSIYLSNNEVDKAIFWYELATRLDIERVKRAGSFLNTDYYGWLPHVQLCVCYDRLKKYSLAKLHNDKAKAYDPSNAYVKYNDKYFDSLNLSQPK
ncbi:glycosyltransferase [Sporolactobacillus shoreicorticis]|uniref:Glycosyltransferase n=1 Tax=Sporolactobacillus shoreicorticis TaxID=1923877 RepID=A0ABW5S7F5_9BACL|nr:glycosyltransferase [Sporolactobacillus shoreicorticis]MCO7128274.1 glycosyltransferase [Sporolactobacillus shoreicorticis]